jgi:urease accessory protein
MLRAIARIAAGEAGDRPIRDTLLLDHEQRRNPAGPVAALRGTAIELVLPRGIALRHDDLLLLDDGGLVEIVARPEELIEIRADDVTLLARAAWLLGDHHIPAELSERRLRVRRGEAILALLMPLGLKLANIEAPFEPEGGAYRHEG